MKSEGGGEGGGEVREEGMRGKRLVMRCEVCRKREGT